MRIGIDACCWSNRRGFGRFTREIITHMVMEFPEHEFVLVVDRHTAKEYPFPKGAHLEVVATQQQPTLAASAAGSRSLLDLLRMGCAVARLPIDAFFFPAVYSFFPLLCRVPTAVTFHDAIAEHHPDLIFSGFRTRWLWGLKTWLARRQASLVLTVTETARAQIASAFGLPAANIHVITEGPHAAFRPIHDRHVRQGVLDKYGLPIDRPLILYVGGISPHKNLEGLLQALCRLRVATPISWHLVLVGDYASDSFLGCYHRLKELATQLGLSDHTTFTGYIPNEDLAVLYNTAVFLVLPSFSEGFGLPLVEAMACGTPVAASSRGAIPEVLGSAGVLFDPEDHAEMAAVLRRLLEDEPLRTQSRAEGLKRVTRYTWSASAHTTVKLLEDMVDAAKAS